MKNGAQSPVEMSSRRTYFQSWKEIASYLKRSVRTCQHWEKDLGLPVHRLDSSPKARIYACREELDKWLEIKLRVKNEADGPIIQHRTISDRIRSIFRHPRAG
jgi:hypothetical protein